MMELVLVNVALLAVLCALPRRPGERRAAGRRRARRLLRAVHADRSTLGTVLLNWARRAGRLLGLVFEPRLFVGVPKGAARVAVTAPALALALLALGGPAAVSEAPVAEGEARACVPARDGEAGRVTTAPADERMTTPVGAGYLTET